MSLPIFYTPRAQETLILVHDFISQKFGAKAATKFVLKSERTIALIAQHPYLFKSSYFDINIRVALITKRTSLFYRVTATAIHLLFFWDNRQEPILSQNNF